MFFKGNRVLPNQAKYIARLGELGASWNGTTSTERVNYFLTVPSANTREATAFMRDALFYPLFDQKELERERVVVLGEFDRNEARPLFHFHREIDRKLWFAHFSRKNVIGDREMIVTTPREKMTLIKERYYIPNNSALLFAGDVRPADAYALADEMFGDWKPAPDPAKAYPVPAHPPLKQSATLAIIQPVKTAALRLGWHGPSMTGDISATFAADVLSFILSQPNSRFSKNLVDSGLFDKVSLLYISQEHTGPISLTGTTTPEKVDAAYAAVQKELEAMPSADYFTDEELAFAKKQLEYSQLYGREQTSNFIHTVSFWWSSAGLDYYRNYLDNLRAVTRKDIRDYLQRYVIGRPRVTGVLVSEEQLPKVAMLKNAEVVRPKSGTSGTAMSTASVPAVSTEEFDVDGTQVILRRNPQSEVVTAKMFYRGGLAYAGSARSGLELLALEVAARETEHHSRETMARELTRLGAVLSSRASSDFTEFTLKSVASNFADSARIFLDAVAHPKFTEAEVRLARERRLNELSREEEDPDAYLRSLAIENAYGSHPYALNPLGTKAIITAVSPAQLSKFYRDTVTRSRLLLVVAGNTTRKEVTDLVRRGLNNLPKGEFKAEAVPPFPNAGQSTLKVVARDLPTVYVQGLFAGPLRTDPDYVAAQIATSALRKRLFDELRTKRNLTYAAAAWLTDESVNTGGVYVSTPDPNAAVAVIRDELQRMRTTALPPAELAAAVNVHRTYLLENMETSEGTAFMLGSMELSAGDWRLIDEFPEQLERTTAEEVRAAMEKWAHHVDFSVLGKVEGVDKKLFGSF